MSEIKRSFNDEFPGDQFCRSHTPACRADAVPVRCMRWSRCRFESFGPTVFKSKLATDWVSSNQWILWFQSHNKEVWNGGPLVSFLWAPRMGYLKREDTTCYSIRPGFVQGMSSWHFSIHRPCWFGQNPQLIKCIYISLNITRYHAHLQLLNGLELSALTLLATTVRFRVLPCQECPRQVLCQRSAQP